jgi:hypothetical protein
VNAEPTAAAFTPPRNFIPNLYFLNLSLFCSLLYSLLKSVTSTMGSYHKHYRMSQHRNSVGVKQAEGGRMAG